MGNGWVILGDLNQLVLNIFKKYEWNLKVKKTPANLLKMAKGIKDTN